MRKLIRRTAMVGGGLSYDVYVPIEDVKDYVPTRYTTIGWNGKNYLNYIDATMNVEHYAMPTGYERYLQYLKHEGKAKREKLTIIQSIFPETRTLKEYPSLWVNNLLSEGEKETSAEVWLY